MAAPIGVGTNMLVNATSSVAISHTDMSGLALFGEVLVSASTPSAKSGYAVGCILIDGVTGIPYCNTGTSASCTFVKVSAT